MERISSILLLIISLSSSFILFANASTRSFHIVSHDDSFKIGLSKLCQATTNPELCRQTIVPGFPAHDVDPIKALSIHVEAVLYQTKKTMAVMDELLAKSDTSKDLRSSIDTCKTQYSSILDSIQATEDAIKNNNVVEARAQLSSVMSFQASCQEEFSDGSAFPFASDSDSVYKLGGNCLDIVAEIMKTLPPTVTPPVLQSPPSPYSNIIGTLP